MKTLQTNFASILGILLLIFSGLACAAQSSSFNYKIDRGQFNSGGNTSVSPSYKVKGVFGLPYDMVASSSANYANVDTTPNAFSFTSQTNVATSFLTTSNTITVAGLAGPSPISISSCDSTQCEYSVNGGAWVSTPGLANNGDTMQVRLMTGAYATEKHLALNIGGVIGAFAAATGGTPATVQFVASAYNVVSGTASVTLSVTRSGGTGAASVSYATADGTALAGTNYTAKAGTLTWLAGDVTPKLITVALLNPVASGINKTFNVALGSPTGAVLGTTASATITILDRSSTVQFSPAALSVPEAGGNAVLTVTRTGSSLGAVSVNYATANGTALAGSDYLATTGTLNWIDGDAAPKTISIPVINDTLVEPIETFTVTLSTPVGASLGTAKVATVSILDDDSSIQFSAAAYSVSEAVVGGNLTVTATRTGTATGAASATYSTLDGTATAGLDYTATGGTLTWIAGDATAKTFTIPITNDAIVEGSETFRVNLTGAVGALLGINKTATVTITDNDTGAGSLQFSAPTYTVRENGVNATLTVTRTGGSLGAVGVSYATANVSATAGVGVGADYTARSGTLNWLTGDAAAKTITVPIINDTSPELTETFTVTLTPIGGAVLGAPAVATVSIIDDDTVAPVGIQFDARKYAVNENVGTATLTVVRGDPTSAAMVNYAASSGTALTATDFLATSGTLYWGAGDSSSRTLTVLIVDNAVAEVTKSFNVTLSNAYGNALGAIPVATVTIIDDDEIFPPLVMPAGWGTTAGADAGWATSYSQFQAGVASLRSGSVGDNQKAQIEVTQNFQNGMVGFALKVSSEANADFLRFYIDGVKKGEWSGIQTTWTTVSYPLVAGPHTLRWSYEKDGALIGGADAAWIDTVTVPALQ